MMTKEDLIQYINNKYQRMEKLLKDVAEDCEDSLRPMLEACVKLFWLVKYDKEPVWVNNGREEFNLQKAIDSEKFSSFFSPFIISDMHSIRLLGNKTVHPNAQRLSASEISELVERLRRIIRETEKVLGCSIIKLIQEEAIKPIPKKTIEIMGEVSTPTNPLLNKTVKHWIYGEGKIIKIVGDRMTVQFAKRQEEYGQESLKNGFLKLVDTQKPKVAPSNPRTYAPNIPEIKQVIKPTSVITECNESPIKSISKFDAIRLFKNSGLNILSRNCTFASKNSMSYLYWANPKTDLLEDDWWLILNDNINYKIHIFKISANSLDVDMIKVRADKPYLIDLQILFDDDRFTDTRSNIQFAKWYIKTLTY